MRKLRLRWLQIIVLGILVFAMSNAEGSSIVSMGPFSFTKSTGYNMTIVIQRSIVPTINGKAIETGDVIAAYTPLGLCVGASKWPAAGDIAVTVWGDDDQTPAIDGAVQGDSLAFRVWDSSAAQVGTATVTWLPIGTNSMNRAYTYATNAMAGLAGFAAVLVPATPILLSPVNADTGSSAMKKDVVTLSWETITGASTYRVQVSTSSTFTSFVINDSTLTTGSKSFSTVRRTTYFWRVCSKNISGTSSWSSIWNFKTTATGIIYIPSHYTVTMLGNKGMLELYKPNGVRVLAVSYEAPVTDAQLLNTASKTLSKGYYMYRIRSFDTNVEVVGKLIK